MDFVPATRNFYLEELSATLSKPRIVPGITATRRATDPFNSFQPISRPISIGSFVGYRRRTNYTNEYLIAKVENIVDFLTQYELKLLKRTQYPNNRIYYTWDEEESHEFTTRMNLVLLEPPIYSYETRGKTRDDT